MIHGLKVYENAGRVVGNRYSEKDTYFTDEGFKLVSGNPITPDAKQVALVHEDFANTNGLNIGDYIVLKNVEGKEVEEKVIGYRKVQQNNKTKYDEYKDYYTITELTQILKCSRHKIMQLYSMEDLPLKMVKNRYIVHKLKLMEWLDEKEKERKEEKIKNVILGIVSVVLMLLIFYMLGVFLKFRFI